MLFTRKGGFLGTMGVALGLLTYVVAPFVQKVPQYPLHQVSGGEAVLYRAVSYSEFVGIDPFS